MRARCLAILIFCVALACGLPNGEVAKTLERTCRQSNDSAEIRLEHMASFPWSSLVVLGPYTSRAAADEALGFHWSGYEGSGIEGSDSFSLLLFLKGERVVHAESVRRCSPDFAPETLGRKLSPKDAVFILRKSGCNVLQMRPAV